jgi:prevent-host-death family protein
MCYMDRIGLRELRQNASRYVDRVAGGEIIEVAVRGRLVARLVPAGEGTWDDLILRGDILPAPSGQDVLDEPPQDYGFDASAVLEKLRTEER